MNSPTVDGQGDTFANSSEIEARLKGSGVRTVMVVDDLLDAGPEQWRALFSDDRTLVSEFIEDHPDLEEWLQSEELSPPESVSEPRAEHYLELLKERLSENEELSELWDTIIDPSLNGAKRVVDELIEHLKGLGVDVHPSGIRVPQAPPENVSVIFIDYALDNTQEDPAAASIQEFKRIRDLLDPYEKPIVVLMSGRTKLTPADEARFRRDTGIMPGMFFRFHKEDLKGISLHLIMTDIAENRDKAVVLDSFINALSKASQAAAAEVSCFVQGLTLEDFALIQLLSLNADGHPLGEYVLWLTGVYFKQLLERNEDVRTIRPRVDQLVFTAPPMTEWGPSTSFLSAYRAAVFADASPDITSRNYPALDEKAKKGSGELGNIVALHFGDIFVGEKDGSPTAYIVVTPECDLVFGGSRAFPRTRSVILLPGNMTDEPPFKMRNDTATRTELLPWSGKDWRVQWRVKEAESIRLGNFKKWAEKMKLTRVARMEFTFASDIQRAYVGNLTRVGIPVVPPQFQPQNATIYVRGWDGRLHRVCAPIENGAYLISSPQLEQQKFILSDYVLIELQKNLPLAQEMATQMPADDEFEHLPEHHKTERKEAAQKRIELNETELNSFSGDPATITALKGPHDIEDSTVKEALSYVTISSKPNIPGGHANTLFTIHLENPAEAEPSESEEPV